MSPPYRILIFQKLSYPCTHVVQHSLRQRMERIGYCGIVLQLGRVSSENHQESNLQQMRHLNFPKQTWSLIRKVKLPLKMFRHLSHSYKYIYIYIYICVRARARAPMRNESSENSSHLFLYYPMARAVWLRSVLPIRTTYRAQSY